MQLYRTERRADKAISKLALNQSRQFLRTFLAEHACDSFGALLLLLAVSTLLAGQPRRAMAAIFGRKIMLAVVDFPLPVRLYRRCASSALRYNTHSKNPSKAREFPDLLGWRRDAFGIKHPTVIAENFYFEPAIGCPARRAESESRGGVHAVKHLFVAAGYR